MSKLLRAVPKSSAIVLLLVGLGVGVFGMLTFEYRKEAKSTEEFCTGCHEMSSGPFVMLQDTTHFRNESGVRPTCSDCHVPKAFLPKMVRKIRASNDIYHTLLGTVDTPDKFNARRLLLAERVWAPMKETDSR